VNALAARILDDLSHAGPDPELLARAGDLDPASAAAAFLRAARHPELAGAREHWVPELLTTARPGFGAGCLADLAEARRAADRPLDPRRFPSLARVLGSSNFLARLLLRRPVWVDELAGDPPAAPAALPVREDWGAIRDAKYVGLLRVAARDLAGRPFAEGLVELSDLADRCLTAGLSCASAERCVPAPALLALGKLGGRELNYSSDVDLLFVYQAPVDAEPGEHHHAMADLIGHFKRELETPTGDGFGYRVDLDLRPQGRSGVLANSVDAALLYYETLGAPWERQMLLRLRAVCGDAAAAREFARGIEPFVYRRSIDPGAMREVRDMKTRIEEERRQAGRDLEADLKEGPGGIRDVEFLVQSLQLVLAGREPALRTGNVLAALEALGRLGVLPEATADALARGYLWLRRAEHALQLAEEQQTARFPRAAGAQTALARRMGYAEPEAADACAHLLDDWTSVRTEVRGHFEALLLGGTT
jgi:glutamate-ammonia-ligase adenylyltransferase